MNKTIFIIALYFLSARICFAESTGVKPKSDIILGIKGGYSLFEGYYKNKFSGSYYLGISTIYSNPAIVKYLMAEFEIVYSRYGVKESANSYLSFLSVNIGPLFTYPLFQHFHVYAGVSAIGSYLFLHTSRWNKNETSLKPGLLARAGFFIPVAAGFRFRVGAEYMLHYLSGKPLHGLNFIGGASYNFNPSEGARAEEKDADRAGTTDLYLVLGNRALHKGDVEEAKAHFARALAIDPNNKEARDKLEGIRIAESEFAEARRFIGQKQYYDALSLLESSGRFLAAARQEQARLRNDLAGEVKALENKGIWLYEKGDYRDCITTMKNLLLIDPQNNAAAIYLPRAVKRQEALERLR